MNFVVAQCPAGYPPIACFIMNIMVFIDAVIVPFIMALAFLVFIWGVFNYFIAGGADEEKRKQGRDFVMWGLIGFVLMLSLWGIVNLLMNSLGFRQGVRPPIPTFNGSASQQGQQNPFGGQQGGYPAGFVCTSNAQCASGNCAVYNSPDGSDPGQKRCL